MKVKVSEATGRVLDYLVAVAAGGHGLWHDTVATWWVKIEGEDRALNAGWAQSYLPSIDWSEGGPIIENHIFMLEDGDGIEEWTERWAAESGGYRMFGPTALVAAMRAYVAGRLGDEVDVPKELT